MSEPSDLQIVARRLAQIQTELEALQAEGVPVGAMNMPPSPTRPAVLLISLENVMYQDGKLFYFAITTGMADAPQED